jgi:hypothetical protein
MLCSGRNPAILAAEMERMMKVQDALLKAMAKKNYLVGGGNHLVDGPDDAALAGGLESGSR